MKKCLMVFDALKACARAAEINPRGFANWQRKNPEAVEIMEYIEKLEKENPGLVPQKTEAQSKKELQGFFNAWKSAVGAKRK